MLLKAVISLPLVARLACFASLYSKKEGYCDIRYFILLQIFHYDYDGNFDYDYDYDYDHDYDYDYALDADVHCRAYKLRRACDRRLGPALPAMPVGRLLCTRRSQRTPLLRRERRLPAGTMADVTP